MRLLAGNFLMFLLLCSIVALGMESFYRFWQDVTDSFSQTKTSRRWFERHFQRNNAGFRDSEDYSFRLRPGRRRVSFIGDSFTAGHGVANVEDRFANRVREMGRGKWEVHVLAEVGRDTGAEIKLIQDLRREGYQFDTVVLVYCLNDINDITPKSSVERPARSPGFLVEHSYFINAFYFRLRARSDPNVSNYYDSVRTAYDGPLWEQQKERLESFHAACEAGGGRLMVVVFPFLHTLGPKYEYRKAHEKISEFWTGMGVPCLDLLPTMEQHQAENLTVNRYDAHPNEHAHALAAEAIVRFLGPRM